MLLATFYIIPIFYLSSYNLQLPLKLIPLHLTIKTKQFNALCAMLQKQLTISTVFSRRIIMKLNKNSLLKKILLLLMVFLLIAAINPLTNYANKTKKSILVLNSYHYGMQWTNNVVNGIYSEFDTISSNLVIHTEYLDTKNFSSDSYFEKLYQLYQYKYSNNRPDVIICSDDDAFNFLLKYRESLFPNIPLVFCGINNLETYQNKLENNITGVVESFDLTSTIEVAKKLQPNIKNVFVINDFSITGQENVATVKKNIEHNNYNLNFTFSKKSSIAELINDINKLPDDTMVLLMTFNKDNLGQVFGYREISRLLANQTNRPIYGVWDFYVGNGVIGGKCIDGFSQGSAAGKMAKQILAGTPVTNIPIQTDSPNNYIYDYNQLQKFGLNLKDLPKEASVLNKPLSFYEENKKIIYGTILLIILQLIIIINLVIAIMKQKKAQADLTFSEEKFNKAFYNVADIVAIINLDTHEYIEVNEAFSKILGYDRSEILNKSSKAIDLWLNQKDYEEFYKTINNVGFIHDFEAGWKTKAGEERFGLISAEIFELSGKNHLVYVWHDITERQKSADELKQKSDEIKFMAYTDLLTNLPNKVALNQWMENELTQSLYFKKQGALMFIDFDDLKLINDTFGHSYGDAIIKLGGKRIAEVIENKGFVSRVGGDEFVVVIPAQTSQKSLDFLAKSIIDKLGQKHQLNSTLVHISASIGIVFYPKDGVTVEELLKNADNAMYAAKRAGKNCWRFYSDNMQKESYDIIHLTNSLHYAIEKNELFLQYQPQIDVKTGKVIGFEALLRWNCKEHGFIPPNRFIPLAEQSGLIHNIGEWVLYEACKFIKKLNQLHYENLHVAINVSPYQLSNDKFLTTLHEVIRTENINPHQLEIEITENALISSLEDATIKLNTLREIGVGVSLDDFGVGYSSLTHLRQLPINKLKIDKSFIDEIDNDNEMIQILSSLTEMAHIMKMSIVAEGVEVESQREKLATINCDFIQGYIFSKPLNEDAAIKFIDDNLIK